MPNSPKPDLPQQGTPENELIESLKSRLSHMSEEVVALQLQNEALQKLVVGLKTESLTDDLTGLHNRRFFSRELPRLLAGRVASNKPFCLVLSDVDQLKQVNDKFGHSAGDEVLKQIASQLASLVRAEDRLCRIGGDEFAIILTSAELEGGQKIAAEVFESLQLDELTQHKVDIKMSFGVAEAQADDTPTSLFDRVDGILYQSKKE